MNNEIIKKQKKEKLYEYYKDKKNVLDILNEKKESYSFLQEQLQIIQDRLNECSIELDVLEQIKASKKNIIEKDNEVEKYIQSIKNKELLNKWHIDYSSYSGDVRVRMLSMKNGTYSISLIINEKPKENFAKIDFSLSISEVLTSLCKKNKKGFQKYNQIKIVQGGKVFFDKKESLNYITQIRKKYEEFFNEIKPPLFSKIIDIDNNKFSATDFLQYGDFLLDGYKIENRVSTDISESTKNEEIPF